MATQSREQLKSYFEDGDTPDQIEFGHLIDSMLNLADTGTQVIAGTISASGVNAGNYSLESLTFTNTEGLNLSGSNVLGSQSAALSVGVTSHSFFGPIYQSSSGAHSASYFLTPVIMGGTTTNLANEGLHIQTPKALASAVHPDSASISSSLLISRSGYDHHLAFDANEIHHYGHNLYITAQGNASNEGNMYLRTSVNPTDLNNHTSVFISSSGNVGIGTEIPTSTLQIQTANALAAAVDPIAAAQSCSLLISRSGYDHHLAFDANEIHQYGHNLYVTAQGNTSGEGNIYLRTSVNPSDLNNHTSMFIKSDGNIGIGNEAPTKKLQVTGDISASGDVYVAGIAESTNTAFRTVMVDTTSGQLHFTGSYGGGGGGGGGDDDWHINASYLSSSVSVGVKRQPTTYDFEVGGTIAATVDVIAYMSSDKRLKDNIKPIENPIEKIKQIGGYTFDWNDNQSIYKGNDVGVIAQEIEKVLPSLVHDREDGYKGVKYDKIVSLLIEAIKDQQNQIDELKKKL